MSETILALRGIGKSFSGIRVLRDVDLSISPGELRALVGANGAGKSTLIKIVAGVYAPDSGSIVLEGAARRFRGPADAYRAGIAVVHQETSLVPSATALQNVFLGREPRRGGLVLDEAAMRRSYAEAAARLGVAVVPDARVATLGSAEKKLVEIMKAVSRRSSILIMDEPTDSLGREEAERLFAVIRDLKAHGMTMIYITHFLSEVAEIADSVTVLRDGAVVVTRPARELPMPELVSLMLGRRPEAPRRAAARPPGEPRLSVRGLSRKGEFSRVSFDLRRGEVLGIVGVVGSGKTELARAIAGAVVPHSGEVLVDGKALGRGGPRRAVKAGIGMAPEDRKADGLILEQEIYKNVTLANLGSFMRAGAIDGRAERAAAARALESVSTRYASLDQRAKYLSGGNQQKCVVAKWLLAAPDILVLDEPTRGIDVGAKAELYAIVRSLAEAGKSILYLSGEPSEVLAVADRVAVMQKGRLRGAHESLPGEGELMREMLEVVDDRG